MLKESATLAPDRVPLGLIEAGPLDRRPQLLHNRQRRLGVLTARLRNALSKGVEGVIEAGCVLIEAKSQLEYGQFLNWVVKELRLGERRPGKGRYNIRKAEMLMFLARHEVIGNSCNFHAFPPSPRTLWELTQIRPKQRLLDLSCLKARLR